VGYGFGHRISIGSMPIVSASSAPAPSILWKIAFFAGAYTNAEYIRQSSESSIFVESSSGDNNYIDISSSPVFISYAPAQFGENVAVYYSEDAGLTWVPEGTIEEPDLNPAPLSALSYSQGSYIQTVVLAGSDSQQSGTYTWDGTTFIDGKPKYMGPLISGAPENNYIYYSSVDGLYNLFGYKISNDEMITLSYSADLASNWSLSEGSSEPIVSNIIYTA
jgi:hypothetical protein